MKLWTAIAAVALTLAFAPAALAQDSVVGGYNNGGGGTQGQAQQGDTAGGDAGDQAATQAGTLPFTGLDVGLVAGGGLLLIVAGAGMAWLARPRTA